MTSTPDDVRAVLAVLRGGVPGQYPELTDETVAVWYGELRHHDPDHLGEAARNWASTMTKFPSLSEFRDAANGVARRYVKALPEPAGRRASKSLERAHLALQKQYQAMIPEHNHRHGEENCPACATKADREAWLADQLAALGQTTTSHVEPERMPYRDDEPF